MKKEEPKQIKVPFIVICIDDSNRPPEIPAHLWPKKGQRYTVIKVQPSLDGKVGFVLEELPLGDDTRPFDSFASHRFGLPMDQLSSKEEEEADKLVKELTEVTQPV